jgi:hypothetical protein
MIQRVSHGPCLGERVGALADGSMAPDAATRALAHVTVCATCREALEVERLTVERLRSLPSPTPSGDLMAALLQLGEPGGPVPLRRRPGPGAVRPATIPLAAPGRPAAPRVGSTPGPARPQGRRRPGTRGVQRRAVLAAAGALGAGVLAMGAVGVQNAAAPGGPAVRPPVDQLRVNQVGVHEAVLQELTHRQGAGTTVPAVVRRDSTRASVTGWYVGGTTGSVPQR